jgi:hypothetical protein
LIFFYSIYKITEEVWLPPSCPTKGISVIIKKNKLYRSGKRRQHEQSRSDIYRYVPGYTGKWNEYRRTKGKACLGDGTPAHTIKKFGVVNRYDLSDEFPILTLRPTP